MSTNHHFHLLKGAKFTKELMRDIEREIKENSKLVKDSFISEDVICINFTHGSFETLFVTTDYDKTHFSLKFPDESLYSGFKYRNGDHNVFVFKIIMLLKYHLKDNIIISSEDFYGGYSYDFLKAIEYINNLGYNISAKLREDNDTTPRIFIDNEEVVNIYDEDGKIFNSMFTVKYL